MKVKKIKQWLVEKDLEPQFIVLQEPALTMVKDDLVTEVEMDDDMPSTIMFEVERIKDGEHFNLDEQVYFKLTQEEILEREIDKSDLINDEFIKMEIFEFLEDFINVTLINGFSKKRVFHHFEFSTPINNIYKINRA